jgi:hypothetical protein
MRIAFLLILTLAFALALSSRSVVSQIDARRRHALAIEAALKVARRYVEAHHIEVARYYVDSVKLDQNPRGDRGKHWVIIYELSDYTKGGQVILYVYMDGSVEKFSGE